MGAFKDCDIRGIVPSEITPELAVAVGTANFTDPSTSLQVIEGIEAYLVEHGLGSVRELVGTVKTGD